MLLFTNLCAWSGIVFMHKHINMLLYKACNCREAELQDDGSTMTTNPNPNPDLQCVCAEYIVRFMVNLTVWQP